MGLQLREPQNHGPAAHVTACWCRAAVCVVWLLCVCVRSLCVCVCWIPALWLVEARCDVSVLIPRLSRGCCPLDVLRYSRVKSPDHGGWVRTVSWRYLSLFRFNQNFWFRSTIMSCYQVVKDQRGTFGEQDDKVSAEPDVLDNFSLSPVSFIHLYLSLYLHCIYKYQFITISLSLSV